MTRIRTVSLLNWLLLSIGYAAIHVTIVIFVGMIGSQIWSTPIPWQRMSVVDDGDVFIVSGVGNEEKQIYRTLDGSVVPAPTSRTASDSISLGGIEYNPPAWQQRLSSFSDFATSPTNWYLIMPPYQSGAAYFVGFDHRSRRQIGFLGTNGFTLQRPGSENAFYLKADFFNTFSGSVVATQRSVRTSEQVYEPGEVSNEPTGVTNAAPDSVWILSRGTVYEVSLRSREVRPLIENRPDFQSLRFTVTARDGKRVLKLVFCTESGLVIREVGSDASEIVNLPAGPPDGILYQLKDDALLLEQSSNQDSFEPTWKSHLTWIDSSGQITRQADIELDSNLTKPTLGSDAIMATIFPCPVVPAFIISMLPSYQLSRSVPDNYFERLKSTFSRFMSWFAVTLMIGCLSAWACRRRERTVFGSSRWFWPLAVGSCGWFGWVGYCFLRPLPSRLPDGHWMPATPEPSRPLGTEIFA